MSEDRLANDHPAAGYIERIVKLEEECAAIRLDIRAVYHEAKDAGHLKGAIRFVVKRQMETEGQRATRETTESEAEQIMAALGMLRDTPLGEAAVERAAAETPRRRRRKENGHAEGRDARS